MPNGKLEVATVAEFEVENIIGALRMAEWLRAPRLDQAQIKRIIRALENLERKPEEIPADYTGPENWTVPLGGDQWGPYIPDPDHGVRSRVPHHVRSLFPLQAKGETMNDQAKFVSMDEFESLVSAPVKLASLDAAAMLQKGVDVDTASRYLQTAVAEANSRRQRLLDDAQALQRPTAAPEPAKPAEEPKPEPKAEEPEPKTAPAPLAAPGSPLPHVPMAQADDESLGQFFMRRAATQRQIDLAGGDARFNMSQGFGLRRR
jgi:hypothetical protein